MNVCGKCKWAKPIPDLDLRTRICMYGPAQVIVIPRELPNGQVVAQTQCVRPNVRINDEAPSCFEAGFYGMDSITALVNDAGTV